jgi:hypothetical protein
VPWELVLEGRASRSKAGYVCLLGWSPKNARRREEGRRTRRQDLRLPKAVLRLWVGVWAELCEAMCPMSHCCKVVACSI